MGYSQHKEDEIIYNELVKLNFNHTGTILDIGANDGIKYSNSRMFIENLGWSAVLVEPTSECFDSLILLYSNFDNIELFKVAIAEEEGQTEIFLGSLNGEGINQVSTLNGDEKKYWESVRSVVYQSENVDTIRIETLLSRAKIKNYDIISIDTEGKDFEILKQIIENNLEPLFIIFEYNNNNSIFLDVTKFLNEKYKLFHKNGINLVFKKIQ